MPTYKINFPFDNVLAFGLALESFQILYLKVWGPFTPYPYSYKSRYENDQTFSVIVMSQFKAQWANLSIFCLISFYVWLLDYWILLKSRHFRTNSRIDWVPYFSNFTKTLLCLADPNKKGANKNNQVKGLFWEQSNIVIN